MTPARARHRGFSLIEMLVALAITALLLTASLSALDAAYRGYKVTTDAASTHVVARIVMHRCLALVRTGSDFAPFPPDVLDPIQNPLTSDFIEFVSIDEPENQYRQITRLEAQDDPEVQGRRRLMMIVEDQRAGVVTREERLLLRDLTAAVFTLEFDVGPVLRRATIDLTILPNDGQAAGIAMDLEAPTIRLVASSMPRQLQ